MSVSSIEWRAASWIFLVAVTTGTSNSRVGLSHSATPSDSDLYIDLLRWHSQSSSKLAPIWMTLQALNVPLHFFFSLPEDQSCTKNNRAATKSESRTRLFAVKRSVHDKLASRSRIAPQIPLLNRHVAYNRWRWGVYFLF